MVILFLQLTFGQWDAYLLNFSQTSQSSLENTVCTLRDIVCVCIRNSSDYDYKCVMCLALSPLDLDQVHIILNIIGSPSQQDLAAVTSEQVL